jgi:hypothetical protein
MKKNVKIFTSKYVFYHSKYDKLLKIEVFYISRKYIYTGVAFARKNRDKNSKNIRSTKNSWLAAYKGTG